MEETAPGDNLRVSLEPKIAYGLRTDVTGNIHFDKNQNVIYPVEGVLAFHDYVNNKQRFIKLPTNTAPTLITINSNRTYIAVVETTTSEDQSKDTVIVLYELSTSRRYRAFPLPDSARDKKITQVQFTCDSTGLAALSEYPDEMLYMIYFDRAGTTFECRAGNTNKRGMASFLACNPQNPCLIAVAGEGFLKQFIKSEKGVYLNIDLKPEINYTSISWISGEMFFVGTSHGHLILFKDFHRKIFFNAKETEIMDLTIESDFDNEENPEIQKTEHVVCMTTFPKGLAYAIFNQVYVYEKISKLRYERKTIIDIVMDNYPEPLYKIANLAINQKQDTVIVTARHSQIYVGILIVPESLKTKRLTFKTIGELIHIDEIIDISVCSWRPIVISSSKDRTIRVWNYQTDKVELVKHFPCPITFTELYASGQYVVIGFIESVKIMQIFMDDLKIVKSFHFANSSEIKFSFLGHLMATAFQNAVAITSAFTFQTLHYLKGHAGTIHAIAWSRCDKYLFSGDNEGMIIRWNIDTGTIIQSLQHPNTRYTCLCIPSHMDFFYAATDLGTIRVISNDKIINEVKMPARSPVKDVVLSKSNLIMFVGTERGYLCNIKLPLRDGHDKSVVKYLFFDSPITKLRFSYDENLLISCSSSGTLLIWQLKNTEGKIVPIDQDLLKSQEVLIPRKQLQEKLDIIKSLEDKLKQQAAEFYNKQSQSEQFDQQQMLDIHKGYCAALAELKNKNEEIGLRHADELDQITQQIEDLKLEHKIHMDKLSEQYSERMRLEYQKFAALRDDMLRTRDSYEEKLYKSKATLRDTVKALESDFQRQLEERQQLIRELMKDMDNKKDDFITYCRQTEIDNDRKMIDCQIEYEKKVKFERDETDMWRRETENHEQKYNMVRKESDMLAEEAAKLKDQHYKTKAYIAQLKDDIKDLHKDVADREHAINVKEERIEEILRKNQELEKYKLVLNHKINELKAQIEPRDFQIIEKRKQITEMESELHGLIKNNLQLELQLKELKDKFLSANVELKVESARSKSARLCITNLCSEIFQVAQHMNNIQKLREGIKMLFQKYSADNALKKFVSLDTQAQADLNRQRMHIEKIMSKCRQKIKAKTYLGKTNKLKLDNKILLEELQTTSHQFDNIKIEIKSMETLIDIVRKTKPSGEDITGLDILIEPKRIENYFEAFLTLPLEKELEKMNEENDKLHEEIQEQRRLLYSIN